MYFNNATRTNLRGKEKKTKDFRTFNDVMEEFENEECKVQYEEPYDDVIGQPRNEKVSLSNITKRIGALLGCEELELSSSYEEEMEKTFEDFHDETFEHETGESDFPSEEEAWMYEQKMLQYIHDGGEKERARKHRKGYHIHEKRIASKVREDGAHRGYGRYVYGGKKSSKPNTVKHGKVFQAEGNGNSIAKRDFHYVNEGGFVFKQFCTQNENDKHRRPSKALHRSEDRLRRELYEELFDQNKQDDELKEDFVQDVYYPNELNFDGFDDFEEYKLSPCMSIFKEEVNHISMVDVTLHFQLTLEDFKYYWSKGLLFYDPLNNVATFRYDEARKRIAEEGELFICHDVMV